MTHGRIQATPSQPAARISSLVFAVVFALLAVAPQRAASQTSLPGPFRNAEFASVSIGLDGKLRVQDLRAESTVAGARVTLTVPAVVLALPARGASLEGARVEVELHPEPTPAAQRDDRAKFVTEAASPVSDAKATPQALAPPVSELTPEEKPAQRSPRHVVELARRARPAIERLTRLLGPVTFTDASLVVRSGDDELMKLDHVEGAASQTEGGGGRVSFAASVAPLAAGAEPGRVEIDTRWGADGATTGKGRIERFPLSAMARALASADGVEALRAGSAAISWTFEVSPEGSVEARGRARFKGVQTLHAAVAPELTRVPRSAFAFEAAYDPKRKSARLWTTDGRIGPALAGVSLSLTRLSGSWRVEGRFELPSQSCETLFSAVPASLLGELRGARWEGTAGFALGLTVDTANVRALRLTLDGEPDGCVPLTLGRAVDERLAALDTPFRAPVFDPSCATPPEVSVGPGTLGYVRYEELPEHVRMGAVVTEDRAFFRHKGISLRLIQGALRLDLAKRRYFYGGSTITQQLVKNLLLSREKSLSRKFQELLLAREVERRLTKERILELYLNCIEYGPGVYGIAAASRFYFGKDPRHLEPLEAVFLMALKPSPRTGFMVFRRGELNARWRKKLHTILGRLVRLGTLEEEVVEAAAPYQPDFLPFDPVVHRPYPKRR